MAGIDTAFLFTAGFGKRMLPLTQTLPKPMVKVKGKMLVEYALDKLQAAGIKRVIMNTHHLADIMEQAIQVLQKHYTGMELTAVREEVILETGGGITHALQQGYLGKDPFFTINGDILWQDHASEPLFASLKKQWDDKQMDILMLLCPTERALGYEGKGDFALDQYRRIYRDAASSRQPYVYAGIQLIKPELFKHYTIEPFSLRRVYDEKKQADGSYKAMYGHVYTGKWMHVGTVESVAQAETFVGRG